MTVAFPLSRLHSILDQFGARLAIALVLLLSAGLAQAAEIYVDGVACQLSDAITAANTDQAQYGCAAGAGADTLILTRDIQLQLGNLPSITSDISIEYGGLAAQEESCGDEDPPVQTREDPTPTTEPSNNSTPTNDPSNNPSPTDSPSNNPSPTDDPSNNPTPNTEPNTNPTPTDDPSNNPTPTADPRNNPTPTNDPSNNPTPTNDPSNNPSPTADPSNNPTPTDDPNNNPTPTDPSDPPEQTFFQPTEPPTLGDPPGTITATATLPPGAGDPEANSAPAIPERCLHVVALGENLYRIALQYGISLRDFSNFNRLSSDDQLTEGQRLIIPHEDCLQFVPYKG